jgi:hypothetical protein
MMIPEKNNNDDKIYKKILTKLKIPIPIRTPLSKCVLLASFSHFLVFKIWEHSLK